MKLRCWLEIHKYREHKSSAGRDLRTCVFCGQQQEFVAVPAAPGAFTDWMTIRYGKDTIMKNQGTFHLRPSKRLKKD